MKVATYRFWMILVHILWVYWMFYYYGVGYCFQYMSFYCILFNTSYFIIGYLKSKYPKNLLIKSFFRVNYTITHTISWICFALYWGAIHSTVCSFENSPIAHILTSVIGHIVNLAFPFYDLYLEYNRMNMSQVILPLAIFVWYEIKLVYRVHVYHDRFPYEWLQSHLADSDGNVIWLNYYAFIAFLNTCLIGFHSLSIRLSRKFHFSIQDSIEERKLLIH